MNLTDEARTAYLNDPIFHSYVHHILAAEGDKERIAQSLYELVQKWLPCEVCGGLIRKGDPSHTRAIHNACVHQRGAASGSAETGWGAR